MALYFGSNSSRKLNSALYFVVGPSVERRNQHMCAFLPLCRRRRPSPPPLPCPCAHLVAPPLHLGAHPPLLHSPPPAVVAVRPPRPRRRRRKRSPTPLVVQVVSANKVRPPTPRRRSACHACWVAAPP
jgi:hypothetical protein